MGGRGLDKKKKGLPTSVSARSLPAQGHRGTGRGHAKPVNATGAGDGRILSQ